MDVKTRSRSELKGYFQKNDVPTESNFAELIDGLLNQKDDGLARPPGDPLSIEAVGDDAGPQKLLNFYKKFGDAAPSWSLSLNPRSNPADPKTAQAGFAVSDGDGQVRLFIDRKTGRVGINTNAPAAGLHVKGDSLLIDGGVIMSMGPLTLRAGSAGPANSAILFFGATPTQVGGFMPAERMRIDVAGNVGIGTMNPTALLDVGGSVRIAQDQDGSGPKSISFARDDGDEKNSGKIAYRGFGTPALSIIGAGKTGTSRNIKLWDDVEIADQLTVKGRMMISNGVIQRGGDQPLTATSDLGLYSQDQGVWMRFVTNKGPFKFFADGGIGSSPVATIDSDGTITAKSLRTDDGRLGGPLWRASRIFDRVSGPLPKDAKFNSQGGTLLVYVSGTGFRSGNGMMSLQAFLDGNSIGWMDNYTNEGGSHKTFPTAVFAVFGISGGNHTFKLDVWQGSTQTDANDRYNVTVLELPF